MPGAVEAEVYFFSAAVEYCCHFRAQIKKGGTTCRQHAPGNGTNINRAGKPLAASSTRDKTTQSQSSGAIHACVVFAARRLKKRREPDEGAIHACVAERR